MICKGVVCNVDSPFPILVNAPCFIYYSRLNSAYTTPFTECGCLFWKQLCLKLLYKWSKCLFFFKMVLLLRTLELIIFNIQPAVTINIKGCYPAFKFYLGVQCYKQLCTVLLLWLQRLQFSNVSKRACVSMYGCIYTLSINTLFIVINFKYVTWKLF